MKRAALFALAAAWTLTSASAAPAQFGQKGPQFVSPEVSAERKITFRILAPKATAVRLQAGDIPGNGKGTELKKSESGIWEATIGPVPAGAYRYHFNVDGVSTMDPRNPEASESNTTAWSLVYVPGSDFSDTKDVPHGAVAKVTYYSTALKKFRRMHVYTPPGYEVSNDKYPVFYLLHGAGDTDNAWSTVGRAGFTLDNLIASGKAKPMVVVMPAGHTRRTFFGGKSGKNDEFGQDFVKDLKPYVEKNYRVLDDQAHRAIAGLSMGGGQTLSIAFAHPEDYGYIGVFSSGVFGIAGGKGGKGPNKDWEEQHRSVLENPDAKKGVKLIWFGCGKEDGLLKTSNATVNMLKSHHLDVVSRETEGGHTWMNWRDYLHEFAPLLFTGKSQ